jgi:uncharacterized protein (DUF1778 family)
MARAVLMISCSKEEARKVRETAESQRRTISGYVLKIVVRAAELDERLYQSYQRLAPLSFRLPGSKPGPRTVMLIRCSKQEAAQIRAAAKRRDVTISGYVLHRLRCSWQVAETFPGPAADIDATKRIEFH